MIEKRGTTRRWRIASVWLVLCLCALLWAAAHYGGWIGAAGEWQFGRFGSYFPTLTVVVLLLLLGVPALLAASRRERASAAATPIARTGAAVRRWRRLFGVVAVAGIALTVAVLLSLLTLPGGRADAPPIALTSAAVPGEGLAVLRGAWSAGRVARLDEDYVFARRTLFVAPVRFEGAPGGPATLLTTLLPDDRGRLRPIARGVLVPRGLPVELRLLYARAGVRVAGDARLLLPDDAAVRWRSLVLAVQVALLALVAGIGWAVLRQQERRIAAAMARR